MNSGERRIAHSSGGTSPDTPTAWPSRSEKSIRGDSDCSRYRGICPLSLDQRKFITFDDDHAVAEAGLLLTATPSSSARNEHRPATPALADLSHAGSRPTQEPSTIIGPHYRSTARERWIQALPSAASPQRLGSLAARGPRRRTAGAGRASELEEAAALLVGDRQQLGEARIQRFRQDLHLDLAASDQALGGLRAALQPRDNDSRDVWRQDLFVSAIRSTVPRPPGPWCTSRRRP
jgi:hypothetical protein